MQLNVTSYVATPGDGSHQLFTCNAMLFNLMNVADVSQLLYLATVASYILLQSMCQGCKLHYLATFYGFSKRVIAFGYSYLGSQLFACSFYQSCQPDHVLLSFDVSSQQPKRGFTVTENGQHYAVTYTILINAHPTKGSGR